jgi:hypothetical protein
MGFSACLGMRRGVEGQASRGGGGDTGFGSQSIYAYPRGDGGLKEGRGGETGLEET